MIADKSTLTWTWTCLAAAILLLFAVSCSPWETLGAECDPATCDQLWSAGVMVDEEFQEVLDAFGLLGVPGADYPMCSGG